MLLLPRRHHCPQIIKFFVAFYFWLIGKSAGILAVIVVVVVDGDVDGVIVSVVLVFYV